jgi:hypothetical protein
MGRSFGLIAVAIVLAAACGIYVRQAKSVSTAGNPVADVDIVGIKHDLMAIAQAERSHNALHGGYASLDELRSSGDLSMSRDSRGFYTYAAEVNSSGFTVTATYNGPANPMAPKSLSIDQSMSVIQE